MCLSRDQRVCGFEPWASVRPRFHKINQVYSESLTPGPEVMLNSTEHSICYANKSYNANTCWHSKIYEHDKYNIGELESKKSSVFTILVFKNS